MRALFVLLEAAMVVAAVIGIAYLAYKVVVAVLEAIFKL